MADEIEGYFIFVVPNISTLSVEQRHSETHLIGNIPWKINVKQYIANDVKQLGVFVWCNWENASKMWEVTGWQTLTVLARTGGFTGEAKSSSVSYNSKKNSLGWSSFIKWDDLMNPNKRYVKDDSIQVSAYIVINTVVGLPSFGYNFQESSSFSDIELVVEGRKLHVNKAYLSNVSPVLKNFFFTEEFCSKNHVYSQDFRKIRFDIKDVKYSEFLVFLAAVHHIPSTINKSNVEFLLKLATRFEVPPVIYQCEQFILSSAEISLTEKFLLSDKYCLATLHDSCTKLLKIPDIEALRIDEGYNNLSATSKDSLFESTLSIVRTMKEA